MYWEAIYNNKIRYIGYAGEDNLWENLPSHGFIKLIITLPAGGKMGISGWDFYALEILDNGLKISFWKDKISNDINGKPMEEPYLNKGGNRHFYNDGTADAIKYEDASIIYKGIPKELIKTGVWVSDELAKELGIL